jgi:ATP-dependent DNA helicase RecG
MNEPVLITERVRLGSSLGESHFREYKSALHGPPDKKKPRAVRSVCEDIALTLVAFANADGGELYVGVEDDGVITGVGEHDETSILEMLNAPKSHVLKQTPLPGVGIQRVQLDSKAVLFFKVSPGDEHVYQTTDGKCVQRRDLESIPISAEQVRHDRQETKSRRFDREFVDGATIATLEEKLVDLVTQDSS